jgi:hypothetical protein
MIDFLTALRQAYGDSTPGVPLAWEGHRLRITRGWAEYGYFKHRGYNDDGTAAVLATGKPYGAQVIDVTGIVNGQLVGRPGRCPFGISITQIIWLVVGLPAPIISPIFFFIAFGGTDEDLADPANFIIPTFLGLAFLAFSLFMVGVLYFYYREPERGALVIAGVTTALVVRHEYLRHEEREMVRQDQEKWANVHYDSSAPPVPQYPGWDRQIVQNPDWTGNPYGQRWVYYDQLTPLQQQRVR